MTEATFQAKALEQDGRLSNYDTRVRAIEVLGELAPGNVDDATFASVVGQEDSQGSQALKAAYATLDNQGRQPVRKGELSLNVQDYGAVGDDSTDDSVAFQEAINDAASKGGGVVYVPRSRYRVANLVLRSGVTLTGGAGNFNYLASSAQPGGAVLRGVEPGWLVDMPEDGARCAAVVGLGLDGRGVSNGYRMRGRWNAAGHIGVHNTPEQGIYIQHEASKYDSVGNAINAALLTNVVMNRTPGKYTGGVEVEGTDHYLNWIESSNSVQGDLGTTMANPDEGYVTPFLIGGADHFINNLVGEYGETGLIYIGDKCRFANIRSDSNLGHGYLLDNGRGGVWVNVTSRKNGMAAANTYDGWKAASNSVGNTVTGLVTQQQDGHTYRYGINDEVNTDFGSRNQYVAPDVRGWSTAPLSIVDFLGSGVMFASKVVRSGSAANVDVFGASTVAVNSSTTTITDFIHGYSGQDISVVATTTGGIIQANSRIRTSSGSNLSLQANRAYRFTFYNDRWVQH
ncbi:glycosyl hydrolase family 28-related protein [Nesterenkonia jeotgali]|uniref:Uncharacterized protein (DUF3820 family) n=1 Tax=Nesterenkonia jeotgali TaxID=317018 RepID=A0A839FFJ1_9MICC|nr:glycosyl hydrolase family 28-related protein [Nesterenkonia jeotgali]MBA8920448.1 uncharacterized protein (DUF3820 family) [Nesterenkonia jeotgali]